MRSILFEIHSISVLQALVVALVLAGAASLWTWRERRAGRLTPQEFRASLALGLGVALAAAALLFLAARFAHPLRVRSYGVLLMCAFGAGIVLATQRAGMYRVDPAGIIDLSLLLLVGSIIGSRLLYVALNWEQEYAADPRLILNVWEGGLSFYGGLIGGTLAGLLFCRQRRVRVSVLADLCAPSVAFGYAIARQGCFMNGCCYGGPTHLPWGVRFPDSGVPGPVHPAQLYSAFAMWLVGVALLALAPRVRVPGHLALWYLVLSSVERFVIEAFRRGYTGWPWKPLPGLTQAQAFSVLLIIIAGVALLATRRNSGYPPTAGDRSQVTGNRTAGGGEEVSGGTNGEGTDDRGRQPPRPGRDRRRRHR